MGRRGADRGGGAVRAGVSPVPFSVNLGVTSFLYYVMGRVIVYAKNELCWEDAQKLILQSNFTEDQR